jgi:hypothetical protein
VSVARITNVKKSLKPGKCEKCGTELPKGSPYLWYKVGFRSRHKHVRCTEAACFPKDSERESSLLSSVYAAKEAAEETIQSADNAEDMQQALTDYAEAIREVADQYEEAMTDDQGNVFNTTAEERYENLTSAADEIEGIDIDAETTECEECEGTEEVECESCGGTGKHEGREEDEDAADCADCEGTGKVDCPNEDCDGGQVPDVDAMREAAQEALETDLGC